MKKLFVAAPMLCLAGALIVQSCGGNDQNGGVGGSKGAGGSAQGGSGDGGQGMGGSGMGGSSMGGMNGGMGGMNGGMGGAAGAGTGGAAGAGTGGAAGAGMGGDMNVAKVLDGFMFLGPCLGDTQAAVCLTRNGNCPTGTVQANSGYVGVLTTDKTLTMGGTMGTPYTVTIHVQGEVESKQYGGMDQDRTKASPAADGFAVGGTPVTTDNYNIYVIRVTNPGSTTPTNYFLNSLQPPGASNHTTYGIDYTAKIQAQGGATLRLIAADTNCSMIKNCGPTQNDGNTCAAPIILANVEPTAMTLNPQFDFTTKPYNGQWIVLTVKGVTSP